MLIRYIIDTILFPPKIGISGNKYIILIVSYAIYYMQKLNLYKLYTVIQFLQRNVIFKHRFLRSLFSFFLTLSLSLSFLVLSFSQ